MKEEHMIYECGNGFYVHKINQPRQTGVQLYSLSAEGVHLTGVFVRDNIVVRYLNAFPDLPDAAMCNFVRQQGFAVEPSLQRMFKMFATDADKKVWNLFDIAEKTGLHFDNLDAAGLNVHLPLSGFVISGNADLSRTATTHVSGCAMVGGCLDLSHTPVGEVMTLNAGSVRLRQAEKLKVIHGSLPFARVAGISMEKAARCQRNYWTLMASQGRGR